MIDVESFSREFRDSDPVKKLEELQHSTMARVSQFAELLKAKLLAPRLPQSSEHEK